MKKSTSSTTEISVSDTKVVRNSKALDLLMSNKSVKDRAYDYSETAKRVIIANTINPLIEKVEKLKDKIFGLEDLNLQTDINAGIVAITRENAAERFTKIIELTFELELAQAELKNKLTTFNNYFS